MTGGSIQLELHHPWTYLFVNLGFGAEVTNFNVSLNPDGGKLLNETGNGTFCWNELRVPPVEILGLEVTDGMEASIQVVTVGDSGSALYNVSERSGKESSFVFLSLPGSEHHAHPQFIVARSTY